MAVENAESLSDPLARADSLDRVPDSSPLRVSSNTLLESGIPPARQRDESEGRAAEGHARTLEGGVERMEAALADALRTEQSVGLLARGLKHLSASAEVARAANIELMLELDELRSHLTRKHEEESALRFRMSQLEQLLATIRHETARERAFLIEEQDLFLVEIMTDHERQIGELQGRLREASQNKLELQKLEELIAQRDQAREYATRCERERDLAWQELATGVVTPKRPSSQTGRVERSPSGAAAIGSISLPSVAVPAAEANAERPPISYSLSEEDVSD